MTNEMTGIDSPLCGTSATKRVRTNRKLLTTWALRERKNAKQKGDEKVKGKKRPFRGESLIKRFSATV